MELEFDVHGMRMRYTIICSAIPLQRLRGFWEGTAGALGIVAGMMQRYPIYVIFGAVVLLYQPVSLWLRAQKQALLPVFKEPLSL